jgi:hypothetical protein
MPPSRQERRKAERDAAKRAPARPGAAGAAGAAAAPPANVDVNQLGDWKTQAENHAAGPCPWRILLATSWDVFQSRDEGSKCVWMKWRATSAALPSSSALFGALGAENVKRKAAEVGAYTRSHFSST